jgi:hypothetical protein
MTPSRTSTFGPALILLALGSGACSSSGAHDAATDAAVDHRTSKDVAVDRSRTSDGRADAMNVTGDGGSRDARKDASDAGRLDARSVTTRNLRSTLATTPSHLSTAIATRARRPMRPSMHVTTPDTTRASTPGRPRSAMWVAH